jgi:glycosyltransferase involved in cell wall biosynthesis
MSSAGSLRHACSDAKANRNDWTGQDNTFQQIRDRVPMLDQVRLLFILPSLGGGGAERASLDLLCGISRERFRVTVALFRRSGSFLHQLPNDIETIDLQGAKQYDLRLVWRLASLIRRQRPEIIFSVLRYANLIALLAHRLAGSQASILVNEQNLPSAEFALFGAARVKGWFLRHLYPWADVVTAISRGIANELTSRYGLSGDKVQVIPNPVDVDRVASLGEAELADPRFDSGRPVVVAAGRLHPQKGFSYLIRAFALVRSALPCKLVILGEGPQRGELEQLITELGLSADIALPGFQDNPYKYMRRASLFVLSSLYEGFGNVLVEALALGTPVVSTTCPVGPDEILTHGETGLLVPPADERALAEAMMQLLQDTELQHRLSANGPRRAADFAVQHIVSQYETLFERVVSRA